MLYVLALVAVVVGVDLLFFRNGLEALIADVGIVLVFAAFYLRYLKSGREPSRAAVLRARTVRGSAGPPVRWNRTWPFVRIPPMAPIISTVEIDRPPAEVFAYVIEPSTFPEWQQGVVRGHMNESPTRVGSQCTTVRNIGGHEREAHTAITEYDPPRRWADRGIDGPIRAVVEVTVEPVDGSSQSRVSISLDFTGHWIGKLLVPLVIRRQAAREMPGNMRRLKQRLEALS